MILRAALAGLALSSGLAMAQTSPGIVLVPYAELADVLTEKIDFERLPQRPEPGFNLDMPLYAHGAWLGERFAGQTLQASNTGHDRIDGPPAGPWLRIAPGTERRNLNVAFHRGFRSNALFPLGESGFPEITARGEGAVAILFDSDQAETGFRIHTEYADPLGTRAAPTGTLEVVFFSRDGQPLARLHHAPGPGISEFGYRRAGNRRDIAGVLILNTDPGGIAVDDIIFAMPPLLG